MDTLEDVSKALLGSEEDDSTVWCIAWHPEGNLIASCGQGVVVRFWSNESGGWRQVGELDANEHSRTIRSLAWRGDGDFLAVGSFDSNASVFRIVRTEKGMRFPKVTRLEGHENEVKGVAWSTSGEFLATCSRDKSIFIYDVCPADDGCEVEYEVSGVVSHNQDVKTVFWHPKEDLLFSGSYDDTIKIWGHSGDDWDCIHTLSGHNSTIWSLAISPDGDEFASCSQDRTVKIWSKASTTSQMAVRQPDPFALLRAASAGAGAFSAIQGYLHRQWSRSGQQQSPANSSVWSCVATLQGYHKRPVLAVSWLAGLDGCIATASGKAIRIFRRVGEGIERSWCLQMVQEMAHSLDVNCVAWSPLCGESDEGACLASCGDDGTVKVWRYRSDIWV